MNIYDSYIDAGQELSAKDKGAYYTALLEYMAYGREPNLKGAPAAIFVAIRPSLDLSRTRAENGSKGGSKRQANTEANAKQTASKTEANAEANGQAKSKSKSNSKKVPTDVGTKEAARFEPPTEEEVDAYLREKGLSAYLTGAEFVGYYASQDWKKANGLRLTSWKLAASGWAERQRREHPRKEAASYAAYDL